MSQYYLTIAQIIVAVFLIVSILLQKRGTALGSAFGGGETGAYSTRRGIQKNLFWASIALGALFMVLALLNLVL